MTTFSTTWRHVIIDIDVTTVNSLMLLLNSIIVLWATVVDRE
ncbi:hypothetical protein [Microbacterium maritypicum]|nr:hypothetical protein [Microbacterium liquefaciens]